MQQQSNIISPEQTKSNELPKLPSDLPPFPRPSETPAVEPSMSPVIYVPQKTVWAYHIVIRDVATEAPMSVEELNELGADGWELVGVITSDSSIIHYFKRLEQECLPIRPAWVLPT